MNYHTTTAEEYGILRCLTRPLNNKQAKEVFEEVAHFSPLYTPPPTQAERFQALDIN